MARLGGRLFIESVTVPFQGGLVFHASVPLVHFDVLAHTGERICDAILVDHIEAWSKGVLHRLRGVVIAVEGERIELPQFGMAIEVTPIAVGEEFVFLVCLVPEAHLYKLLMSLMQTLITDETCFLVDDERHVVVLVLVLKVTLQCVSDAKSRLVVLRVRVVIDEVRPCKVEDVGVCALEFHLDTFLRPHAHRAQRQHDCK